MTTPNIDELIDRLYDWHNTSAEQNRLDMQKAADLLQSQAERIAELERESETHSKAYGLAIVERDNLRHELKTAQEGWRCECSTDDACRFARERDALRAELGDLPEAQAEMLAEIKQLRAQLAEIAAAEPVYYEFQWTNPGNQPHQPGSMFVWARVEPAWNGTVQQKVDELLAYRYDDKPTYRVRVLFTRPMPAESKDAERYRWLRDYLISPSTHFDDLIVSADKADTLDGVIDAAIAKGAK